MKSLFAALIVIAFVASTAVSFLSGRFLRGFLFGISCFFIYLIAASLRAAGWELDGLLFSLGWDIAVILLLGLPICVVSVIAALAGVALSERAKSRAVSLGVFEKVAMPKYQKVILLIFIALALGLMFIGGLTIQ